MRLLATPKKGGSFGPEFCVSFFDIYDVQTSSNKDKGIRDGEISGQF